MIAAIKEQQRAALEDWVPVALVSTTQRAGEGLAGRISYLFEGMGALALIGSAQ